MRPIGVLIVEPNQLTREGLKLLLRKQPFVVVADVKSPDDTEFGRHDAVYPAIVMLGSCSDADVDAHVATVRQRCGAEPSPRIVLLADIADAKLVASAASAGVDAVLSRDISSEVLQRSLELVVLGQQLFPPTLADPAIEPCRIQDGAQGMTQGLAQAPGPALGQADLIPFPLAGASPASVINLVQRRASSSTAYAPHDRQREVVLSERESQIMACLVNGASNKAIARDLQISEATVKVHVKGLLRKVRANNRTQAAIWGLSNAAPPADCAVTLVHDLAAAPGRRASA